MQNWETSFYSPHHSPGLWFWIASAFQISAFGKSFISLKSTCSEISLVTTLLHPISLSLSGSGSGSGSLSLSSSKQNCSTSGSAAHNLTLLCSLTAYFMCLCCLLTRLQYLGGRRFCGAAGPRRAPNKCQMQKGCSRQSRKSI